MAATAALKDLIRVVPDYPKPGISFKDLTTLLKDGPALRAAVDAMYEPFAGEAIDLVVGIESRGFILGAPMALRLGCGFVPVRKPGKLPSQTLRQEYQLEYGRDALEIHLDAILPGQSVLVVDDLLATGGTTGATCQLVEGLGGRVAGLSFLVELAFLNGREKLRPYRVESAMQFSS